VIGKEKQPDDVGPEAPPPITVAPMVQAKANQPIDRPATRKSSAFSILLTLLTPLRKMKIM